MRISEVCEQTGVSDKTVRFYIEKGLLKKSAIKVNGRNCRDYDEKDVSTLKDIVILRNAGLSIQDILDMQNGCEDVDVVIERQIAALECEKRRCEQNCEALQKLRGRKITSWRKVAELLRQGTVCQKEEIVLHWPKEDMEPLKKRLSLKTLLGRIAAIVGLFLLSLLIYGYYQSIQMMSYTFPIGEVVFHDRWWEDGKMYAELSCAGEQLIGHDSFFAEQRTVEIVNHEHYESIVLDKVSYQSVTLQIEVSKGEAYWDRVLTGEGEQQWLDVEKILQEESLLQQYCKLVAIYSEDKR